ncbi:MAG TPA: alpha/beta hydrolase [Thermoguttaceae bacterium]|nr:alpha/beta hydrolase [Thermoguttaceae bacterium]
MKDLPTRRSDARTHLLHLSAVPGIALAGFLLAGSLAAAEPETGETEYALDKDVAYLPKSDQPASGYADKMCRLDLYRPQGVKGFPTVVFYHGGGLKAGKRSIPAPLTNRGWAVVGVGYRLHPEVRHPVYIEDAAAALAWTFKNIESMDGDPKKIFVTGISAGGYLTAMVGLDKTYLAGHDVDADQIAGLIPVTGQMITHQTVRKEQGIEPSQFRPTIDKYAPLYHVRNDTPPVLCITGGWGVDMLMRAEENLYFVSMMKLVGHKAIRHVVIEGADHGRCGAECWPHVIAFIEARLAEMNAAPEPAGTSYQQ